MQLQDKFNVFDILDLLIDDKLPKNKERILVGLLKNCRRYGAAICPCILPELQPPTPKAILKVTCPCERLYTEKECRCGLFEPPTDDDTLMFIGEEE